MSFSWRFFKLRLISLLRGWLVIRSLAIVLFYLKVLREEYPAKVLEVHLRSIPVPLWRLLLLDACGRYLEHVLPWNKFLDVLQGHLFDTQAFDDGASQKIFPRDKTLAIWVHRGVCPPRVSVGRFEKRPQGHFEIVQEMFLAKHIFVDSADTWGVAYTF